MKIKRHAGPRFQVKLMWIFKHMYTLLVVAVLTLGLEETLGPKSICLSYNHTSEVCKLKLLQLLSNNCIFSNLIFVDAWIAPKGPHLAFLANVKLYMMKIDGK